RRARRHRRLPRLSAAAAARRVVTERVALVTGGASGMGAATAALLRAQDVAVGVLDVPGTPPVDVSDPDAVDVAVAHVRAELGPIDIVVNAAGIGTGGVLEDRDYLGVGERTLAVNLPGAMHVVRAFRDDLVASRAGRIVNVCSTE